MTVCLKIENEAVDVIIILCFKWNSKIAWSCFQDLSRSLPGFKSMYLCSKKKSFVWCIHVNWCTMYIYCKSLYDIFLWQLNFFNHSQVWYHCIIALGVVLNRKKSIPEPGTCMLHRLNSDDLLCVCYSCCIFGILSTHSLHNITQGSLPYAENQGKPIRYCQRVH